MKFGLFYQLPCADSQSEVTRYQETIEQVVAADELGFDCAWLAELHFFKPFSIMPSPLIVATAIAQQTKRIRLGTAVNLLPLYPPLRCAEDGATVDMLTNGRLDFGVGRGAIPLHFQGFNVPREESRERFEEALQIIEKAWTTESFSFNGKHYQVPETSVVPKPVQKPYPPIRIAANSPETAAFAGEHGYAIFVASVVNPLPKMREQVAIYQKACAQTGRQVSKEDLALMFFFYVGDGPEQVRQEVEPSINNYFHTAAQMIRLGERSQQQDESYKYLQDAQRRLEAITYDTVERDLAVYGSPQQCISKVTDLFKEFNMGHVLCWFNPGGMVPQRQVLNSMERFAKEVMPALRAL
jgi:alkanesulfonate monooxygenase SsuD/methylene tetrahydromethanopterin reductase-like flavin-dependent oxidoreductase (luciferase family)